MDPNDIAKLLSCDISVNNGNIEEVVTIAIFRRNPETGEHEVLLEIRGNEPEAGKWALPGGHVDPEDPDPKSAAIRELGEETNLQASDLTHIGQYTNSHGLVDNLYAAVSKKDNIKPRAGDDAVKVQWVPISLFQKEGTVKLAFNHAGMLRDAIAKLMPDELEEDIERGQGLLTEAKKQLEKGLLIVLEGVDGAGKSTATHKVMRWLRGEGYAIQHSKWNSHEATSPTIAKLKEKRALTPMLYCLLHASDMLLRYNDAVLPGLAKKKIVVCDRYIYTSMVRDGIRGIDQQMLDKIYKGFKEPDMIIYCKVPTDVAVQRILKDGSPGYYSSGMDLGLAETREQSLEKYEEMMDKEYDRVLTGKKGYFKVDTTQRPNTVAKLICDEIKKRLL
jgi:dTMP kinase